MDSQERRGKGMGWGGGMGGGGGQSVTLDLYGVPFIQTAPYATPCQTGAVTPRYKIGLCPRE